MMMKQLRRKIGLMSDIFSVNRCLGLKPDNQIEHRNVGDRSASDRGGGR